MKERPLPDLLSDPSRPVFLLGEVPPQEGTPPGKCQDICNKFQDRSRALACDGFIVYDIPPDSTTTSTSTSASSSVGRKHRVMDSSPYAALLSRSSGKPCLVYKCVTVVQFEKWVDTARSEHGHTALNLVGLPSSSTGSITSTTTTTMEQAMQLCATQKPIPFGCVCVAERHTLDYATARHKPYPTEHINMVRKQQAGAQWFIAQAVYDAAPTIRLLRDYAATCRQKGLTPQKVVLTFCPVSRTSTLEFIKWLGVRVPPEVETTILQAERPVEASVAILCRILTTILAETVGLGVPLGISCESVSIYKAEIDGVHDLFRKLQGILLDARGTPWKVQWVELPIRMSASSANTSNDNNNNNNNNDDHQEDQWYQQAKSDHFIVPAGLNNIMTGMALGGALVVMGVMLGKQTSSSLSSR